MHDATTWEQVLANPVAMDVIPLYTGDVEVDRSMVLNLEHEALENREDTTFRVPVMAYLIHHERGSLLIDSGLDSTFTERDYGATTFRDFVEKLARTGVISLKHMDRSILVEPGESRSAEPLEDQKKTRSRASASPSPARSDDV